MTDSLKRWLAVRRNWAILSSGTVAVIVATAAVLTAFGGRESDESTATPTPNATSAKKERTNTATASPSPSPTPAEEVVVTHDIDAPEALVYAPAPAAPAAPGPAPAAPVNIMHGPPYTVVIDPGHGPNNSGTGNGAYGLVEKNTTLDVALRLGPMLTAAGYNVILTRYGDYNLSHVASDTAIERRDEIQARVDLANEAQADILVSIHFNGSSAYYLRGTEVYYNPDRSFGHFNYALADFARQGLVSSIRNAGYDTSDRGIKNDSGVGGDPRNPHSWILGTNDNFSPSMMPGIIGEALFMSNGQDAQQLTRPEMRQAIAEGYKAGIDAYFGWLQGQLPQTPTPTAVPMPEPTPQPTPEPTPSPSPSPSPTSSPTPSATPSPTPSASPSPTPATPTPEELRRPSAR